ncbi:MAG: hypothetical protein IJA91_06730, partial [Clostridia bacterium]|nr:hypothetical protein [Clostridia bacterium]
LKEKDAKEPKSLGELNFVSVGEDENKNPIYKFRIQNVADGYKCDPEQDVLLYAYNCLQVGFADVGVSGKDDTYKELGCGVHSVTGDQITFNWSGTYCPKAGEDFVGSYDAENQVLVYEMRLHLQSLLDLDRLVENGDEINYAWILAVNGQAQTTNETWQLGFCHGIGGQYSGKCPQYFARIAFTGKPDGLELTPEEIPGMSEEDIEYGLYEFIDFADENVVNTFNGEFAGVEYITEGEESFMRITSFGGEDNLPHVFSSKYPKNILGGTTNYIVVKYRTSYAEAEELGVIFRTVNQKEYVLDDVYWELIGGDGEWHTVVFYMSESSAWNHFIMNIGFVPFVYAENSAQQTIDIAWMKFYNNDPYDLYVDSEFDDGADEETTVESVQSSPVETQATGIDTEAGTNASAGTENTADTDAITESGCASMIGMSAVAVLATAAAFVALKKKED